MDMIQKELEVRRKKNLIVNPVPDQIEWLGLVRQKDINHPYDLMGNPATDLQYIFCPTLVPGLLELRGVKDVYNHWYFNRKPLNWTRMIDIGKKVNKTECLETLRLKRGELLKQFIINAYYRKLRAKVEVDGIRTNKLVVTLKASGVVLDIIHIPPLTPRVKHELRDIVDVHERIMEGIFKHMKHWD